jgi:hypothetical protein
MLTRLPTELAHLIYKRYFSFVMKELLERQSQKNDFIVRTTRSNASVTEVNTQLLPVLTTIVTSKLYRKGIRALPLELEQAYGSESSEPSFPPGGGYVSSYVRNIVNRVFF